MFCNFIQNYYCLSKMDFYGSEEISMGNNFGGMIFFTSFTL